MAALHAVSLVASLLAAPTPHPQIGPTVYVVDGLSRVRPDSPPGRTSSAIIQAARNEYEPFQIVVNGGDTGLKSVELRAYDLKGPGGASIRYTNVHIYREHYLTVTKPSPKSKEGAGSYPDALIPIDPPYVGPIPQGGRFGWQPYDVPAHVNQPFWVDVYVPKNTPPGEYRGEIKLMPAQGPKYSVPIKLTVWSFTLPDTPSMRSNFGGFDSRVAKAHGMAASDPDFRGVERAYAEAMAAHRICPPIPYYLYPRMNPDGSIDPSATHAALKEWIDTLHVTGIPLHLPGRDPAGAGRAVATRYLREMYAYLKSHGWEKMAYIYVLDEPNDKQAYDEVRKLSALIHEAQPGIRVLCTEQPTPQEAAWGTLVGSVNIWVPLWPLLEEKAGQERLAAGDELWSYTALCQGEKGKDTPFWELDFPLLNYRIPAWLSRRYGMTGLLYWTTVYWEKAGDPWTNPLTYEQFNGEGSLLYPGSAFLWWGPAASMRLKQIREGMEDYEYLCLLDKLAGPAETQSLVRRIARAWTDWDPNPAALYALRQQIAQRIIAASRRKPR